MAYRVEFTRRAERQLAKLQRRTGERIARAIAALADDPRPSGVRKLTGSDEYRIRVGDHRIIYAINDGVLLVTVIKIGHRRDVYER